MPFGDDLLRLFGSLGPVGLLAALFVIFYLDSIVIPLLPEVFAILIFQAGGATLEWGLIVLALAEAGEVLGNTTAYLVVRRVGLPARVRRAMESWTHVLLAKRETLILTNRIAPAVPFVGFFIAALGWSYRRSITYVAVGGLAKYSVLLLIVGGLNVAYNPVLARDLTLGFILAFVAISIAIGWIRKRRMGALGPHEGQRGAP
ncbi:MAG TPA: hypothetical protein VEO96_06545 [Thermoplasmata archaeon]|nr:hypothetical protein [Thermoplasmata archaeon]